MNVLSKGTTKTVAAAAVGAAFGQGPVPGTEVDKPANTAVGNVIDFAADAGSGMEGADADSYAVPFLVVLQPGSPQVVEKTVDGAQAGMFMNSVTNELYGESAILIPCAFNRRFIRWGARDEGGGYKGDFSVAEVADLRSKGAVKEVEGRLYFPEADGSVNEKKSDKLSDTRNHYVIVLKAETDPIGTPAVLALTSTGIKRSKNFLSRIEGIKLINAQQKPFTPPSFSHLYRVKTTMEKNDQGVWYSPEFSMIGPIKNAELYGFAKAFHDRVLKGQVDVNHDSAKEATGGNAQSSGDGRF